VATSVDALIVGMGITFLKIPLLVAVSIIGAVTFLLSMGGIYMGTKFSKLLQNKTGIFGGLVLIVIGVKILIDHLFF
jgi:putative Mn2+ efflux pump MntP